MGMVVRTNTMSANAYRQLGMNNTAVSKSLEKLSSGFRINRAGDDASGLAISEKMKAQISGLEQASANSQDGISLVQTAEGALTEVHSMLNRMVELATKSSSGTIQNQVDRDSIQTEVDALKGEISRVAQSTDFNGIKLLDGQIGGYNGALDGTNAAKVDALTITGGKLAAADTVAIKWTNATTSYSIDSPPTGVTFAETIKNGVHTFKATVAKATASAANAEKYEGLTISFKPSAVPAADGTSTFTVAANSDGSVGAGLTLQVGTTNDTYNKVTVTVGDMSAKGLSIDTLDVSSATAAAGAIDTIKTAINTVSTNRGNLGAMQNRLEHAINNLDTTAENMTSANSRIRDTDMAKEMMTYTKMNILSQAAQAMLAQANQNPQSILQLLQ